MLCIVVSKRLGLLQGDRARAGATPSKWPTELALTVAVGHCDGVAQAFTLKQMHCGKGLRADTVYLLLQWLCLRHVWCSFKVGNAI